MSVGWVPVARHSWRVRFIGKPGAFDTFAAVGHNEAAAATMPARKFLLMRQFAILDRASLDGASSRFGF